MGKAMMAAAVMLLAAAGVARASLVMFEDIDKVAPRITVAVVAKIEEVATKDTVQEFTNGKKATLGQRVTYKAKVTRVLWGADAKADDALTVEYHTPIMVKYNDAGEIKATVSLDLPGTGLEHGLKVGSEYVLCFAGWRKEVQILMRAEPVSREPVVVTALQEPQIWDLAKKKLGAAAEKVRLSAFDPVKRRLAILTEEGTSSVLYIVSEDGMAKLSERLKLEGDQMRWDGEFLKVRSGGKNVRVLHTSTFEPVK